MTKIGSVRPAAVTGEMTSDRIGTASPPSGPRPPLEKPTSITAGIAAAQNLGSCSTPE